VVNIAVPIMQQPLSLDVYNIEGRLITRMIPGGNNEVQINMAAYEPGMYIVRYGGISARFIKE
jgi:hypothetical protein